MSATRRDNPLGYANRQRKNLLARRRYAEKKGEQEAELASLRGIAISTNAANHMKRPDTAILLQNPSSPVSWLKLEQCEEMVVVAIAADMPKAAAT